MRSPLSIVPMRDGFPFTFFNKILFCIFSVDRSQVYTTQLLCIPYSWHWEKKQQSRVYVCDLLAQTAPQKFGQQFYSHRLDQPQKIRKITDR